MKVAQHLRFLDQIEVKLLGHFFIFFILFLTSYGVIITLSFKNVKYLKITKEIS